MTIWELAKLFSVVSLTYETTTDKFFSGIQVAVKKIVENYIGRLSLHLASCIV